MPDEDEINLDESLDAALGEDENEAPAACEAPEPKRRGRRSKAEIETNDPDAHLPYQTRMERAKGRRMLKLRHGGK